MITDEEFQNFTSKIIEDKVLKSTEKSVLLAILTSPEIEESNNAIAEKIGVSLPTAAGAIRKLHQLGYIEVTYETDGHTSPRRKIEVKYGN